MTVYILVDGSYFCFYRYHAIKSWWKFATPDIELDETSVAFADKFRSTFVDKMIEIPRKLKVHKQNPVIMVGKDCPQQDIWRMAEYADYKGTRNSSGSEYIATYFRMVYGDNLFQAGGATQILHHPHLEADDCIAIATQRLLAREPDAQIYIITSDTDYLQLVSDRVKIFTMQYKELVNSKTYCGDPERYLFCKTVLGDKSDNIPRVFSKCGPKTALKLWDDKDLFEQKLDAEEGARERYEHNRRLISFREIPADIYAEFCASHPYI
jgi:5'-3' exonuclease